MEYIFGHKLVGHLEAPNLCRPISQQCISEEILATEFFGEGATKILTGLLSRKPPKDAENIEKLVDEEFNKGYQSRPFTASQMNAKYGVGRWRPMPLFIHEEASGKQRLIANGKGGGHNAATSEEETLYVISTAFAADACGVTCRAILESFIGICEEACQQSSAKELATQMPEWAEFGLGCEDMVGAFRQCPVAPEHLGANVIAYFSVRPKSWRFVEVVGMVYGMRSSVVHFSRFPTLCSSIARRVCAALAGSYVDDFTVVDVLAGTGQLCTQKVVECCGRTFSKEKHTSWRPQRVMLRVHVRLDATEAVAR